MFGIEFTEILLFGRIVGLGAAGAAAFWGLIFLFLGRKTQQAREAILWNKASVHLLWVFFPSLLLYAVVWGILALQKCIICVGAHEGISLVQDASELTLSLQNQYPFFLTLIIVAIVSFGMFILVRRFLLTYLWLLYGVSFVLISVLFLYSWGSFESIRHSVSLGLHNWHAIFTFGTVIVSDFLYMMFRRSLQPILGRIFLMITLAIWLGLGLDFLSSGLIFQEEFAPTDRFLFAQTLIGILIINGVFLAGPLSRILLTARSTVSLKFQILIGVSGSISLVGWLGNGALDSFRSLTLSYWVLFGIFVFLVSMVFLAHEAMERLLIRYRPDKL